MASGIYQILNVENGKRYIGSAVDFEKRWRAHMGELRRGSHHSIGLQRAYNKYGERAIQCGIILNCPANKWDLLYNEQWFIDMDKPEYNTCKKAGNCMGRKFSAASKAKLSATITGRKHTPEWNANIGVAGVGRIVTAETREKQRAALKGRPLLISTKQKISKTISPKYLYCGETLSAREWADKLNRTYKGFRSRLSRYKGNPDKIFMYNNTTKNSPRTGVAMHVNSNLESASMFRGNTVDLIKGV
jgi:group I intron endonuclease